jgi:hypothetical protein
LGTIWKHIFFFLYNIEQWFRKLKSKDEVEVYAKYEEGNEEK